MDVIKIVSVQDLAQNFLRAPRMFKGKSDFHIIYDYEMDSGKYSEKTILFENAKDYRHVEEDDVTAEMIDAAYNSIVSLINSDWMDRALLPQGYNHYLIYFDGYGAFEVIAKSCQIQNKK